VYKVIGPDGDHVRFSYLYFPRLSFIDRGQKEGQKMEMEKEES
jgi:hypothetical protein